MKTIKKTGIRGNKFTLIFPETKEDLLHIESMEKAGAIDMNASFGDYKEHSAKKNPATPKTKNSCKKHTPQPA